MKTASQFNQPLPIHIVITVIITKVFTVNTIVTVIATMTVTTVIILILTVASDLKLDQAQPPCFKKIYIHEILHEKQQGLSAPLWAAPQLVALSSCVTQVRTPGNKVVVVIVLSLL